MKKTAISMRTMAFMLALVFTFVTVFSAASMPAYAAAKKPAKVTGVKVTARSNYTVRISWKKAKNAKKYEIYRATSKKGKYKKVATTTQKAYDNYNLTKGKKYFYKIRAVNGKKKGAFSAVKYAATYNKEQYEVVVDKEAKSVTISARVNGKYFTESTRHLMIDSYGFNKGKAMLTSYCTPYDLYYGLVKAGGKSWSKTSGKALKMGEKNTIGNAENKDFSKLDVTISWGGKTYDLKDCLTTEKGAVVPPEIDMIFAANPKAAAKTPSGCMTCMDSCYIGIVANCAYGLCVIDNKNPALYARQDVLPANDTVVQVTYTIK